MINKIYDVFKRAAFIVIAALAIVWRVFFKLLTAITIAPIFVLALITNSVKLARCACRIAIIGVELAMWPYFVLNEDALEDESNQAAIVDKSHTWGYYLKEALKIAEWE